MSNQSLTIATPIVTLQNGKAFANSRDVAEYFGRRHDNVLQIIDRLECSEAYRLLNYQETADYQKVGFASRVLRTFNMTKDGFVFLVMGFTGKQAAHFKEAYITRFNEMEATLKAEAVPVAPRSAALGRTTVMHFEFEGFPLRAVASEAGPRAAAVDLVRIVYESALSLHAIDNEQRVLDTDLAERLGFERPRKIRELINRKLVELQRYGVCPAVALTSGVRGGRPSVAYYLNEEQAILVCMFSTFQGERFNQLMLALNQILTASGRGIALPHERRP